MDEQRLATLEQREEELRRLLLDAHDQLLARDDEMERDRRELAALMRQLEERDEEVAWLRGVIRDREEAVAHLNHEIAAMQATRVWQLGTRWWSVKRRLAGK